MAEKQTRVDSFMEAVTNIAIGLGISTAANQVFIPLATGHAITLRANIALAVIYTLISLARSYLIRRAFNGKSVWCAIKGRIYG